MLIPKVHATEVRVQQPICCPFLILNPKFENKIRINECIKLKLLILITFDFDPSDSFGLKFVSANCSGGIARQNNASDMMSKILIYR